MEATAVEMKQSYWVGIDDNLADGIQFIENHAGLTESTEVSPQRPAKKRARFSSVLDTQIWIPVSPPPPARPSPPPLPTVGDDSQFESVDFEMSPPSHPTPAAPVSHPPPQLIQVILTTST